jgi:SOS regulatory protein LexA
MTDTIYVHKLRHFFEAKKRMPSFAELAELCGFASKYSAVRLVERLTLDGYIEKDGEGKLLPGERLRSIRVLGVVEAGFPSPGEEDKDSTLTLDEYLIDKRDASYILKVKGDSMKNAGILDGDMVVVERTKQAKLGSIVIAVVDGEYTMKYLREKNGTYFLEPANEDYPIILPKESLQVEAVVKGVVRKY